jgi:hypothetical protein
MPVGDFLVQNQKAGHIEILMAQNSYIARVRVQ